MTTEIKMNTVNGVPLQMKEFIFKNGVWNDKYTHNNSYGITFGVDKISVVSYGRLLAQNLPIGCNINYKFVNNNLISSGAYVCCIGSWNNGWISQFIISSNKFGIILNAGYKIENNEFCLESGASINIDILEIWIEKIGGGGLIYEIIRLAKKTFRCSYVN